MEPRKSAQPTPPWWEQYFNSVSNKEWLAAKALLETDPHRVVLRDAAHWILDSEVHGHLDESGEWVWELEMDWDAWVYDVEDRGRGWSGTEHRLFALVAALVTREPIPLVGVLDMMGSWEADVWRILTEWGTGGDNRRRPGAPLRLSVTPAARTWQ